MNLNDKFAREYDKQWEQVKDQYTPDPATQLALRSTAGIMELIAELEKITKRTNE